MNSFLFYSAVGLSLGGGIYLLTGRRNVDRGFASVAIACGVGVLAAGIGAWVVLALDVLSIAALGIATFRHRHVGSPSTEDQGGDKAGVGRHSSGTSLRKGFASLISAAIGGILLSIIWSNPIWRIKSLAERELASPGVGIVLISLIALLLLSISFFQDRRTIDKPLTRPETKS